MFVFRSFLQSILFGFILFCVTASRLAFYLNISGWNRYSYVSNYENAKLFERKWKLFIIFSASFKQWKQFQTLQLNFIAAQVHDAQSHWKQHQQKPVTEQCTFFNVFSYLYRANSKNPKTMKSNKSHASYMFIPFIHQEECFQIDLRYTLRLSTIHAVPSHWNKLCIPISVHNQFGMKIEMLLHLLFTNSSQTLAIQ